MDKRRGALSAPSGGHPFRSSLCTKLGLQGGQHWGIKEAARRADDTRSLGQVTLGKSQTDIRKWRPEPHTVDEDDESGGWSPLVERTEAGVPSVGKTLRVVAGAPRVSRGGSRRVVGLLDRSGSERRLEPPTAEGETWRVTRGWSPLFPPSRNRA